MRPNSATPAPVLVGGAQAKLRPCDCALQDKCIAGRLHPQLCFYEEQVCGHCGPPGRRVLDLAPPRLTCLPLLSADLDVGLSTDYVSWRGNILP
jgi:hypothetical protein